MSEENGALRYLTFRSGDCRYALPADAVAEIIAMPEVARLPLGPPALLGMANLRGSVIAVASLRGLLGLEGGPSVPGQRAILLTGAVPVAISVDRVDALVSVEASQVETRQAELAADAGEVLHGAFRPTPDAPLSKILDIQILLSAAFEPAGRNPRKTAKAGQNRAQPAQDMQELLKSPPSVLPAPRGAAAALPMGSAMGDRRVMIVDDASLVRRVYRDVLEKAGCSVDEAPNGLQALEKLLSQPAGLPGLPGLLIVDVNMPVMDGITFLQKLRRQALPLAGIPALVTSAEAAPEDRLRARLAGANGYLVKPVPPDRLLDHVRLLCAAS